MVAGPFFAIPSWLTTHGIAIVIVWVVVSVVAGFLAAGWLGKDRDGRD